MSTGRSCTASGLLLWSTAVATGLGAVLAASATVYTAVRLAGVTSLLYLGVSSLRSALRLAPHDVPGDAPGGRVTASGDPGPGRTPGGSLRRSYRQGPVSNALNPKAAVTFLAPMPQFLPRQPSGARLLVLCLVTLAIGGAWFQLVAAVVGGLRRVFAHSRVRRVVEAVTGVVLVAFGVRLAAE